MSSNFLDGLAHILGVAPAKLQPEFRLSEANWDSVAVMSTIALIDEHRGITVSGTTVSACKTVADILKLADL